MTTNRLEAFSDGVLAIAITLLILEIRVPDPDQLSGGLAHYLGQQWSSYAAYVVSFVIIGIIWVNHHAVFDRVSRVDRPLLLLNLLLLMWIAFLPFPTALVARYFRHGHDARVAMAVYSGTMLAIGLSFQLVWRWICRLEGQSRSPRFGLGPVLYAVAVGLSFVSPALTLTLHFLVAGYYVFDQLSAAEAG